MHLRYLPLLLVTACSPSPSAPVFNDMGSKDQSAEVGTKNDIGRDSASEMGSDDQGAPNDAQTDLPRETPILVSVEQHATTIGGTFVSPPGEFPRNGVPFVTRTQLVGGPPSTWLTDVKITADGSLEIARGTAGTSLEVDIRVAEFDAQVDVVPFSMLDGITNASFPLAAGDRQNSFGVFHYSIDDINSDLPSSMVRMSLEDLGGLTATFTRNSGIGNVVGTLYVVTDPRITVRHGETQSTNLASIIFGGIDVSNAWLLSSFEANMGMAHNTFWKCTVQSGTGVCERAAGERDAQHSYQVITWPSGDSVRHGHFVFGPVESTATAMAGELTVSPMNGRGGMMRCELSNPPQTPAGCFGLLVDDFMIRNESVGGASTWMQALSAVR